MTIPRLRRRLQRDHNFHPEVAALAVNTIIDELRILVTEQSRLTIQNFGLFEHKLRAPRLGQKFNGPGNHVPGGIIVPARLELKFTPCPEIAQALALMTPTAAARPTPSHD